MSSSVSSVGDGHMTDGGAANDTEGGDSRARCVEREGGGEWVAEASQVGVEFERAPSVRTSGTAKRVAGAAETRVEGGQRQGQAPEGRLGGGEKGVEVEGSVARGREGKGRRRNGGEVGDNKRDICGLSSELRGPGDGCPPARESAWPMRDSRLSRRAGGRVGGGAGGDAAS